MFNTETQKYIEISEIFDLTFTQANHVFKNLNDPSKEQATKAIELEIFNESVQEIAKRIREWKTIEANEYINEQNLHLKDCALVAVKEILNCNLYESQMALFQLYNAHPLSSLNIKDDTVKEFKIWFDEVKSSMPDELKKLITINSQRALQFVDYSFESSSLLDFFASSSGEIYNLRNQNTGQADVTCLNKEKERAKNLLNLIFNRNSNEFNSLLDQEKVLDIAKEILGVLIKNLMELSFQKVKYYSDSIFEKQSEFNLLVGKCILATSAIHDKDLGFYELTDLGKKRIEIYTTHKNIDAFNIFDLKK